MSHWSMAQVRKTFKKVIHASQKEPQILENRGEPVAVILDFGTYKKLERNLDQPLASLWKKLDNILSHSRHGLEIPRIRTSPPKNPWPS